MSFPKDTNSCLRIDRPLDDLPFASITPPINSLYPEYGMLQRFLVLHWRDSSAHLPDLSGFRACWIPKQAEVFLQTLERLSLWLSRLTCQFNREITSRIKADGNMLQVGVRFQYPVLNLRPHFRKFSKLPVMSEVDECSMDVRTASIIVEWNQEQRV